MLVSCPECDAEISDEADPCPYCGLTQAGVCSKEYNERCVRNLNRGFVGYDDYSGPLKCGVCGYVGTRWKKTEAKLTGKAPYYDYKCGEIYCPKCDAPMRQAERVSVLEEKERQQKEWDERNKKHARKEKMEWILLCIFCLLLFLFLYMMKR